MRAEPTVRRDGVHAPAVGHLLDELAQIDRLWIDDPVGAQRLGLVTTGRDRVGGDDARAEVAGDLHVHQADRPQPDDQLDLARIETQHVLAAQHAGQWFHHGGGFQAGVRAQQVDVPLGHTDIIGIAAAILQKGRALAAIGATGAAGLADAALDDHVGRHRLPDFQILHILAHGGHGPGDLVAEDAGKSHRESPEKARTSHGQMAA